MDFKTSDFVSAPRKRGTAPARPGPSLLTAVGPDPSPTETCYSGGPLDPKQLLGNTTTVYALHLGLMASRPGQTRRGANPQLGRDNCGCVLPVANFGTAALPDIDRAVPGDAEGGRRRQSSRDRRAHLARSHVPCHPPAWRRLPGISTRICQRQHSSLPSTTQPARNLHLE